jgi:carbonic anhydrase
MQTLTYAITRTLLASRLKAASVEARGGHDCCKNSESTEAKMTDWLIIKDQVQSILEDVRRIKSHPWVPWNISVYALVYDVKSGKLIEVPEATAIGK